MSTEQIFLDAEALDAGYKPFLVEGQEAGELSEIVGRAGVRAGGLPRSYRERPCHRRCRVAR